MYCCIKLALSHVAGQKTYPEAFGALFRELNVANFAVFELYSACCTGLKMWFRFSWNVCKIFRKMLRYFGYFVVIVCIFCCQPGETFHWKSSGVRQIFVVSGLVLSSNSFLIFELYVVFLCAAIWWNTWMMMMMMMMMMMITDWQSLTVVVLVSAAD